MGGAMQIVFQSDETNEEMKEIAGSLFVLCSIPAGSIPCDRRLGLSWAMLSEVLPEFENDYATEFIEKAAKYEPRAQIVQVSFQHGEEDTKVIIEIERAGENGRD